MGERAQDGNERWDARFGRALALLCALFAGLHAAVLAQELRANPFAALPFSDAEHYWRLAGAFAEGRGLGETPFLVAPLYPLLAGLVRRAGGGLAALYALQAGLHVATAALVAAAARARL